MSNDRYTKVTARIMRALEQGTVPWRKPWRTGSVGGPYNGRTSKPYRGLNPFVLETAGYSDPRWITFKQAADMGGYVRKGQHGEPVYFFDWHHTVTDRDDDGEEHERRAPIFRVYTVFNAEQTEGIPWPALTPETFDPIERAAHIIDAMPERPTIVHGGDQASYRAMLDTVALPVPLAFDSPNAYYATAFHELGHSTGHPTRLGRFGPDAETSPFGSQDYSKEELVAEFTAAFLCAASGIETQEPQSAAYIQNWLSVLSLNRTWLVSAASKAQQAADFILGEHRSISEAQDAPTGISTPVAA